MISPFLMLVHINNIYENISQYRKVLWYLLWWINRTQSTCQCHSYPCFLSPPLTLTLTHTHTLMHTQKQTHQKTHEPTNIHTQNIVTLKKVDPSMYSFVAPVTSTLVMMNVVLTQQIDQYWQATLLVKFVWQSLRVAHSSTYPVCI